MATSFESTLPELRRTVRIPADRFGRFQARFGKAVVSNLFTRAIPAASKAVQRMLEEETIKRGIFYKKRFARGWRIRRGLVSGLSAQVFNKEHYAIVIEKGRRAGRTPPPSHVLIQWVIDKLGVSRKDAPRVAFLVARSIGIRGIAARPILGDPRMQLRIRNTVAGAALAHMRRGMDEGSR